MSENSCAFCQIVSGEVEARIVFESDVSLAFLDRRPLFPGHALLVPRVHYETLAELPSRLLGPFFADVQLLSHAIERAMQAEGTFVAINNRVSQSVPHVHVHVVPRRKGDGLRGFFWPRSKYADEPEAEAVQKAIRHAVGELRRP